MNTDIIEGKWKQLRGRLQETWGKITDDDLDRIEGRWDRLAGVLEEKYGYARDRAEREAKRMFGNDDMKGGTRAVSVLLAGLLMVGMSLGLACSSTDPGLTSKVKSKLVADTTVKAYKIDVDTRDKVVTLTGNVDTQAEKDQAMRLARDTKGVRDVVDMIAVRTTENSANAPEPSRTLGERVDDAGITMAVKGRLLDDPQVKGLRIDVDTREGVVYLTGTVRSTAEKDRAVELARNTENVRNVVTNLTIEKS